MVKYFELSLLFFLFALESEAFMFNKIFILCDVW